MLLSPSDRGWPTEYLPCSSQSRGVPVWDSPIMIAERSQLEPKKDTL